MYKQKIIEAARKALKAFDDYDHWREDWPAAQASLTKTCERFR